MNSVGDAFGLAFRDPGWVGKVVVQALILIIPIIGWIATAGWMMMTFDNFRAGRMELAPAGFHLERGIRYFGVVVIYAIVLNIPATVLNNIGRTTYTTTNGFTYYGTSPLGSLWSLAASLFLNFLIPSLIVLTYHRGFAGGMDVLAVWRYATSNVTNSVVAGAIMFVAGLIALVGLCGCIIGVFFTAAYAITIQAGVAAWFERAQSAPATPAAG